MILTFLLISCVFTTRVLLVTTTTEFGWNEIIIFKLDKKPFTSISTHVFIYDCPTNYFLISIHGGVKEDQLNSRSKIFLSNKPHFSFSFRSLFQDISPLSNTLSQTTNIQIARLFTYIRQYARRIPRQVYQGNAHGAAGARSDKVSSKPLKTCARVRQHMDSRSH